MKFKMVKVDEQLLRRVKTQAAIHDRSIQDIVATALSPVVDRLERESSRFRKPTDQKTRAAN
jgi:hypothetical protein